MRFRKDRTRLSSVQPLPARSPAASCQVSLWRTGEPELAGFWAQSSRVATVQLGTRFVAHGRYDKRVSVYPIHANGAPKEAQLWSRETALRY